MLLNPGVVGDDGVQRMLEHTAKARADSEVLLMWRGDIDLGVLELIDDEGMPQLPMTSKPWEDPQDVRPAASGTPPLTPQAQAPPPPTTPPLRTPPLTHPEVAAFSQQIASSSARIVQPQVAAPTPPWKTLAAMDDELAVPDVAAFSQQTASSSTMAVQPWLAPPLETLAAVGEEFEEPDWSGGEEGGDSWQEPQERLEGQGDSWWSGEPARSSQSWTPVASASLRAWLQKHGLDSVHSADEYGWTALHHVAMDSYDDEGAAAIFDELMLLSWKAAWVDPPPICQQWA